MADAITIMRCQSGGRATKLISKHEDGGIEIAGYDAGKHFKVGEIAVDSIHEIAAALDHTSRDPLAFVIRAEPLPGIDRARSRRLIHTHEDSSPPTFRDVHRQWTVFDFDAVPGPYRFDPQDGGLASIYCRSLLPKPWWRCSYWWALSSSAGFKPGVRIKLAFWLARPALGSELERHLKGCPIDPSTLRAVQPIYIAAPILVGIADPIRRRTGLEEDIHDAVELPELPPVTKPVHEFRSTEGHRYVSGSSRDVASRRLDVLCRAVEVAGVGGRHRCLLWAAARAVELDDALPRAEIAAELIVAARRAGLDDSEADLARQVRNGFKIGIFGAEAAA